ncbi:MAG TPA: DUF4340 domain-containing protein [Myxococcota bacterium]|nr:DUF4340 domain-containing protein [Myxococcota bacterium]HQP95442.1 DUF4340 domain-containing protein [Myxococcota bacterium]
MKRRALVFLSIMALMALLLAILLLVDRGRSGDVLSIPAIQAESVDSIVVVTGGRSASLVRDRDSGLWSFDGPERILADSAVVKSILGLFETPIVSDIVVESRQGAATGFETGTVTLKILSGGQALAQLDVGESQTFEGGRADTFVRRVGQETTFRVTGRNIRQPFEKGLNGLRSGRLFSFVPASVLGLHYSNPSAPDPRDRVVRLRTRPGSGVGIGNREDWRSRDWSIVEPEGVKAGRIGVLAGQVAGVMVDQWLDELPEGVSDDPDDPSLTVHLAGDSVQTVRVAGRDEYFVWISSPAGVARIRASDAAVLVRTAADVRDTSIFSIALEDMTSISVSGSGSSYSIIRRDGSFLVAGMPGIELDRPAVEDWLMGVSRMSAQRAMRRPSAAGLEVCRPWFELGVTSSGGDSAVVSFCRPDAAGEVMASVGGEEDVFIFKADAVAEVNPGLDGLRRRSLLKSGVESVTSIEVSTPDGGQITLSPPAGPGSQWAMTSVDGVANDSREVTAVAASILSMSVTSFLDRRPASVRPDAGRIKIRGRGFELVVGVSSEVVGDGRICVVTGDRYLSGQALVIPESIIGPVLALADRPVLAWAVDPDTRGRFQSI